MPGLMAIRKEFKKIQPLKGAKYLVLTYDNTNSCINRNLRRAWCRSEDGLHAMFFYSRSMLLRQLLLMAHLFLHSKASLLDDYWSFTHKIFEWL